MVAVLKSKLAVKRMKSVVELVTANPGEIRECRSRARHPFLSGCFKIGKNTYGTLKERYQESF
jgi:hypothetical protein